MDLTSRFRVDIPTTKGSEAMQSLEGLWIKKDSCLEVYVGIDA